jgi:hypothetical protein
MRAWMRRAFWTPRSWSPTFTHTDWRITIVHALDLRYKLDGLK